MQGKNENKSLSIFPDLYLANDILLTQTLQIYLSIKAHLQLIVSKYGLDFKFLTSGLVSSYNCDEPIYGLGGLFLMFSPLSYFG